jgi:uncharacterized membrane protein YphA (DoxX/SURF4 family)
LKTAARYLLAAAFLASALTKIVDPHTFAGQVAHSGVPTLLGQVIVAGLPWLELTCGFCLAFGVATREATAIVAVLLVVFLVYSLFHRDESECGCLLFPRPLRAANRWPWLPLRNLVLLACAVLNLRR